MSKPIKDLGDLICQHLTFCYATDAKRAVVKMSKEMSATFEQLVAASLAEHIAERFEVIPKAKDSPPMEGRSLVE